ncbi:MAG: DEAD/DEAH box helicase [Zoogloeaceae bacterium]|jgi:superfamily II DNA or RNA helicase|nr:DEAD/DEAH box helicase [Zoogloeaceae bacterium]
MAEKAIHYTREDLIQRLGLAVVERGEVYRQQDRVETYSLSLPYFKATVRGTARQPYRVSVLFSVMGTIQKTACSCPLGGECKHVAAALLDLLRDRERQDRKEAVSPGVLSWLTDLRHLSQAVEQHRDGKRSTRRTTRLYYCLRLRPGDVVRIDILKGSAPETAKSWVLTERAMIVPPQFVAEEDLPILRQLWKLARQNGYDSESYQYGVHLKGENSGALLEMLLASERLFVASHPGLLLEDGGERSGRIVWKLTGDAAQYPEIEVKDARPLPVSPPWYLDANAGEIGRLDIALPPALATKLLALPPLSTQEAVLVAEALAEVAPNAPRPVTDPGAGCRVIADVPRGRLRLDCVPIYGMHSWRDYPHSYEQMMFDYATVEFCYGDARIAPDETRDYLTLPGGEIVRVERDRVAETRLTHLLNLAGFRKLPMHLPIWASDISPLRGAYGLDSEEAWPEFMANVRPTLEQSGWQIVFDVDFRHHYLEVDAWHADVDEAEGGWLSLDMGVMVAGERLSLAPLLANLFQKDSRWLDALALSNIPADETVTLKAEDGRRIRVTAERLKPIARMLIDLFDGYREGDETLRLSRWDAARLDALQEQGRWQFKGPDAVVALAERLKASKGVRDVVPPKGFQLELRDYQRTGLAWLQYLREQELAGILADDMGLGKTAQALAHLLLEKEAGRLDKPALIVLPTSLVFNWRREAERFAPDLRVLCLHGKDRRERFAELPECDMALTTYPLLWRDGEELGKYEYHMLILDEAQTVKNFRSKGAMVVRQLQAQHRLCLTGTPLENHLGELWAQFDFLLPGFLDDSKRFTRLWRNPIEKQGDILRRDLLARRLRPFILRRKKDEVATELPPKTVIVRTVELEGGQRDLYETVRVAMDEKVRSEIARQGFRRSQIVILDALLKLRQVCCDPRLVKLPVAQRVKERAKLDLLMNMLPELVAEGRRVLLFSQFTSMLDLIETVLDEASLCHVRLDGATRDREAPVAAFQNGEVPVFLISLKAGGVGLNLTAADTVIHYDPWWNPAVENQATDRAHRLGQDKPVFVYKLIAAGSIEEKILALQEHKAELAAGILSEGQKSEVKFSEADIAALFEPLPGQRYLEKRR